MTFGIVWFFNQEDELQEFQRNIPKVPKLAFYRPAKRETERLKMWRDASWGSEIIECHLRGRGTRWGRGSTGTTQCPFNTTRSLSRAKSKFSKGSSYLFSTSRPMQILWSHQLLQPSCHCRGSCEWVWRNQVGNRLCNLP